MTKLLIAIAFVLALVSAQKVAPSSNTAPAIAPRLAPIVAQQTIPAVTQPTVVFPEALVLPTYNDDTGDEEDVLTVASLSAPPAPVDTRQCNVDFYVSNQVVYSEVFNATYNTTSRPTFKSRVNNRIDEIMYDGDCYCWTLLFADSRYGGHSIGLWLSENDDNNYIELDHYLSYSQDTGRYTRWDQYASSYSVYCYF